MYATTTSGHLDNTSGNKETKVLQELTYWGNTWGRIIQDTETKTEEWVGLSYSDALSLYVSSETSTLNGVTRQWLGVAKLTSLGGAFVRAVGCWGVKVVSSYNRMGDTNLYQVTRTTTTYTVRAAGDGMTLTLE